MFKLNDLQIRLLKIYAGFLNDEKRTRWHEDQKHDSVEVKSLLVKAKFEDGNDLSLDELFRLTDLVINNLGNTSLTIRKDPASFFRANDLKLINEKLRSLLYSSSVSLEDRVNNFFDLASAGVQTASEFLVKYDYEKYPYFADFMQKKVFKYLEISSSQFEDAQVQSQQEFSLKPDYHSKTRNYFIYWIMLKEIKLTLEFEDYLQVQNVLWIINDDIRAGVLSRLEDDVIAAETGGEGGEPETLSSIERVTVAHLLAGKNVIFYGPPGTGKTFLAKKIARMFCGNNFLLRTGNAELTAYDVIGGLGLTANQQNLSGVPFALDFKRGFLTFAAQQSVELHCPYWIIFDEINRANLDLSFGKAFTLLDVDHRDELPLVDQNEYPNVTTKISLPKSFRIIATMNNYDKAILFSLGFAFRRRFAFIEVPSPFKSSSIEYDVDRGTEQNWRSRVSSVEKNDTYLRIQQSVEGWIDALSDKGNEERLAFSLFSNFEEKLRETFDGIVSGDMDPYNPQAIIYVLAKEVSTKGLVEFGLAQMIDGLKFAVAFIALFGDKSISSSIEAIDNAFLAYFVPQFEYIIPDLRREKISGDANLGIEKTLDQIILILSELGLGQSMSKLQLLKKEQKVF